MQAKPVKNKDWHQQLLAELTKAPVVQTRLGPSFTIIGHLLKFDLSDNFPATRAKKLFFEQVKRELYCFLKGMTSKKDLNEHGVHIWDDNMRAKGLSDIGPIYGWQWRRWNGNRLDLNIDKGFDQLRWAINDLVQTNGASRRALVSAWNPPLVLGPMSALPPCHVLFQFNIVGDTLYTDVFQRSADAFLGLPFDVASFAILSRLVKNELYATGFRLVNERLNYHISNLHLYAEHIMPAMQEIANDPCDGCPWLECYDGIDTFQYTACMLRDYEETRIIKAKLLT